MYTYESIRPDVQGFLENDPLNDFVASRSGQTSLVGEHSRQVTVWGQRTCEISTFFELDSI